jgi:hypothetical protein
MSPHGCVQMVTPLPRSREFYSVSGKQSILRRMVSKAVLDDLQVGCAVLALVLLPAVATGQAAVEAQRAETYEAVTVDVDGSLVITTSDRRTIVLRREGEQTGFANPIISAGGAAVGAQAEFRNCCTSYDIPLQLVIYVNGTVHRFNGNGLPIFRWHFVDGGMRVAYAQEPVHFGCSVHYELRDVHSERLIDSTDVPEPCGQMPNPPPVTTPTWVADLDAKTR